MASSAVTWRSAQMALLPVERMQVEFDPAAGQPVLCGTGWVKFLRPCQWK
jgi:hypothetical protein